MFFVSHVKRLNVSKKNIFSPHNLLQICKVCKWDLYSLKSFRDIKKVALFRHYNCFKIIEEFLLKKSLTCQYWFSFNFVFYRFGLFEAMSAIEIMDPKMDAGMICNRKRKVIQLPEAIQVRSNIRFLSFNVKREHTLRFYFDSPQILFYILSNTPFIIGGKGQNQRFFRGRSIRNHR